MDDLDEDLAGLPGDTKEKEEVINDEFVARDYQDELLPLAVQNNCIIYLPTGSGKTFLATMIIKHFGADIEKKLSEGGKRAFFLVNTVQLVEQQAQLIKRQTTFTVGEYTGQTGCDLWSEQIWKSELDNKSVIVMTSQILLNLLSHSYLKLSNIRIIVFDECHNAVKNHPMRCIMKFFENVPASQQPHVVGLTGSLLNSTIEEGKVNEYIRELEATFLSRIITSVNENMALAIARYSADPQQEMVAFSPGTHMRSELCTSINIVLDSAIRNVTLFNLKMEEDFVPLKPSIHAIAMEENNKLNKKLANMIVDIKYQMENLGAHGAYKAALAMMILLERKKRSAQLRKHAAAFQYLCTMLTLVRKISFDVLSKYEGEERIIRFVSNKVLKLLELFKGFKETDKALIFVTRRFSCKCLQYILEDLKLPNVKSDFIVGYNTNPFNDTREGLLEKKVNKKVLKRSLRLHKVLTTASAHDIFNLERLETLGDSFLKYAVSLLLFIRFPELSEGQLTMIKGKVIGNRNLYYCGEQKGLGSIIKADEFNTESDWIAPGFCVDRTVQNLFRELNINPRYLYEIPLSRDEIECGKLSPRTKDIIEEKLEEWEEDLDYCNYSNAHFISQQVISNKTVSDSVEALLGLYIQLLKFPLFITMGEIEVEVIVNQACQTLSEKEIDEIFNFHCIIFSDVLQCINMFMFRDYENKEHSYLLAPIKLENGRSVINWSVIRDNQEFPEIISPPVEERQKDIVVTEEIYKNSVVIPWYRGFLPRQQLVFFSVKIGHSIIVVKICKVSILPLDFMENNVCKSQLHSVQATYKRKKKQEEEFEESLVPELCVRCAVPAAYWLKATLLPSCVHRITALLLADELRVTIATDLNLSTVTLPPGRSWRPISVEQLCLRDEEEKQQPVLPTAKTVTIKPRSALDLDTNNYPWGTEQEPIDIERAIDQIKLVDIVFYDDFVSKPIVEQKIQSLAQDRQQLEIKALEYASKTVTPHLSIFNSKHEAPGVELADFLQVLTTASAHDIFNLERLETLGDSFLKYAVSLLLFIRFPELSEGQLTMIKGKVIGNRNLYYCGEQKGLGSIIKADEFNTESDWIAPGFCVDRTVQNLFRELNINPRYLYEIPLSRDEIECGKLSPRTKDIIEEKLEEWEEDLDYCNYSNAHFISQQVISNKTVSDSVEALLGLYIQVRVCSIQLINIGAPSFARYFYYY
ncbi:endoribonuclease Dicer-like [Nilaparvata lugens]|uniref:endoribonuclease Dicer-like n=1 Tax=Nilaparvata lugens TaxID=108931 RepID=UPI00193E645C|nr:endoribonuclease Dicer-like [Nilaparvata lugens]